MKPCRILLGCMLASLSVLCGGASAQVVTEFSAGITVGAGLLASRLDPMANCGSRNNAAGSGGFLR